MVSLGFSHRLCRLQRESGKGFVAERPKFRQPGSMRIRVAVLKFGRKFLKLEADTSSSGCQAFRAQVFGPRKGALRFHLRGVLTCFYFYLYLHSQSNTPRRASENLPASTLPAGILNPFRSGRHPPGVGPKHGMTRTVAALKIPGADFSAQ